MRNTRLTLWSFLAVVMLVIVVAGCGDDDATTTSAAVTTTAGETTTTAAAAPGEVGMSFEREGDPMIAWMIDTGLVDELEAKYNVVFTPTETPDDFAFFAGGHGNVIQLGSYEVPFIEAETGIATVTFGAIRSQATIWLTRADNPANTFADLVGETITNNGPGGSAYVWQFLVKELHGLDMRYGGGDFNWVASGGDRIGVDMVLNGEAAATACNYTSCADVLANGQMKVMYDGRTAGQLYTEELGGTGSGDRNLWHNTLVARADWYDTHPNEVAFVLELFERAMEAWNADPGAILTTYAADMGLDIVDDAATLEYLTTTAVEFDPVLESVYLTPEAVAGEQAVLQGFIDAGIIPSDAPLTRFEVVAPPCDTAPDLLVCAP